MIRLTLFIFLSLVPFYAVSQYQPLNSLHQDFVSLVNPAAISPDYYILDTPRDLMIVKASHREQWLLGDNLRTIRAAFNSIVSTYSKQKFRYGANFIHDQIGELSTNSVCFDGAYYVGELDEEYIGLGLSVGLFSYNINFDKFYRETQNDPTIIYRSPRGNLFDTSIGIYAGKKIFDYTYLSMGYSISHFTREEVKFTNTPSNEFDFQLYPHQSLYFSMLVDKSKNYYNDFRFISASIWFRYVEGVPIYFDVVGRGTIGDLDDFWLGIGYSSSKSLIFQTGINTEDFPLTISINTEYHFEPLYDNGISLEIMLGRVL